MQNRVRYRLVKRDVWQPHVRRLISPLEQVTQDVAMSILSNLHSRHCGITVEIAVDVALSLQAQRPDQYAEGGVAAAIIQRMRLALRQLSGDRYQDDFDDLLSFRTSMQYVVYKLIQPLIDLTCRDKIGYTVLMADDNEIENELTAHEYSEYISLLRRDLMALINGPELPQTFWHDRALILNNIGWQKRSTRKVSRTEAFDLPNTSLADTAIFVGLDPNPRTRMNQQRNFQVPRPKSLRDDRLYDPGFDGITRTTRLEELHHMLPTEYIYPFEQRMDRLFNSGFWILKPPPRSIKMRDALIVSLAPNSVLQMPHFAFLKTCWFDFSIHMASILRQFELTRSEFRWIQGDNLNRMYVKHLLLSKLDAMPLNQLHQHSKAQRQYYLRTLEWLPDFLDDQPNYVALQDGPSIGSQDNLDSDNRYIDDITSWWLYHAWRQQGDSPEMREQDRTADAMSREIQQETQIAINRFGFIHATVFLPRSIREMSDTIRSVQKFSHSRVAKLLRVPISDVSITWVPEDIMDATDETGWKHEGLRTLGKSWRDDDNHVADVEELASDLVDVWLQDILAKMTHG